MSEGLKSTKMVFGCIWHREAPCSRRKTVSRKERDATDMASSQSSGGRTWGLKGRPNMAIQVIKGGAPQV